MKWSMWAFEDYWKLFKDTATYCIVDGTSSGSVKDNIPSKKVKFALTGYYNIV